MIRLCLWMAAGLASALVATAPLQAQPTASPAVQRLIQQGNYWHSHGRDDLATDAWKRLLLVDPSAPDALLGLGQIAVDTGNTVAAQQRLAQLLKSHPAAEQTQQLRMALGANSSALITARMNASQGHYVQAVQAYQDFFGGSTPTPDLALEYYQVLAASGGAGSDQAIAGLRNLVARHPNDADTRLVLAKVLSYHPDRRLEGTQLLARLQADPAMSAQVKAPWRQALLWLDSSQAGTADALAVYLKAYPGDVPIAAKLQQATRLAGQLGVARDQQVLAEGFRQLHAQHADRAAAIFSHWLAQHPDSAAAMGGLGSALMQQQLFDQALPLLQKASRIDPHWKDTLQSITYWQALQQAQAQLASNPRQAVSSLRQLTSQAPGRDAGWAVLAQALLAQDDAAGASDAARRALALDHDNVGVRQTLIQAYLRQGDSRQAESEFGHLDVGQQQAMGGMVRLRSDAARSQAKQALDAGDLAKAGNLLNQALAADPQNAWLALDLARLYVQAGQAADARRLIQHVIDQTRGAPAAWYASALLSSEQSDWTGVYISLHRIDPAQRSPEMQLLLKRAAIQLEIGRAVALARQGQAGEARQTLIQLEPAVSVGASDLLAAVATGYAQIGDLPRARQLAQRLLQRGQGQPDLDLSLQYGSVLLAVHEDAPLLLLLRQLEPVSMNGKQAEMYQNLRRGYILRQVDVYMQMGNLEQAYAVLAPLLQEDAQSPQPLQALARLYVAAGKPADALAIYEKVLQLSPQDVDSLLAAAGVAEQLRDFDAAGHFIDTALAQTPHAPNVLASAARLYRARGDDGKAAAYFRAALDAQVQQLAAVRRTPVLPAVDDAVLAPRGVGNNPFAGITGSNKELAVPDGLPLPALPSAAAAMQGGAGQDMLDSDAGINQSVISPQDLIAADAPQAVTSSQPYVTPARDAGTRNPAPATAEGLGLADIDPPLAGAGNGLPNRQQRDQAGLSADVAGSNSRSSLMSELRQVQSDSSDSIDGGMVYRNRNGTAGLGKLDDLELPIQAKLVLPHGKLTATVTPTLLDAGTASSNYTDTSQFGAGPAAALDAAIADDSSAVTTLTGSTLFEGLLTQGDTTATRNFIYQAALSNGEYDTLYNDTDSSLTSAERKVLALDALYELPLASYLLSTDLSSTKLATIAEQIEANSSYSSALTTAQLSTLKALASGTLGSLTPTQFVAKLNTMAAAGATAAKLAGQSARGAGVSAAYDLAGLHLDLGSTPLGFIEPRLLGGLAYHGQIGENVSVSGSVFRRSVSDSLVSFAGTVDPRTGQRWGGVTSNGARIQLGHDSGGLGLYGYGSYAVLVGTNVQKNTREEAGGGAYLHLIDGQDQSLSAGLNVSYMQYANNLQGFTFGQGGYFSPQRYLNAGLPIHWSGRKGRLNWLMNASIGVQTFREKASNYFPTDAGLQQEAYQAAAVASLLGLATYTDPVYQAQSKTGLGYNFDAAAEYQVAPKLYFGGRIELNNASNYQQLNTSLYLRYMFDDYGGMVKPQPTSLLSPYSQQAQP